MLNLCDELRKKLYLWSQEKFWPILEENKQLKEENEQLKEDVKRYRNQASRLRNKNNRLSELLKGKNGETFTHYLFKKRKQIHRSLSKMSSNSKSKNELLLFLWKTFGLD